MKEKMCLHCGEPISPDARSTTKYCSVQCRTRHNSLERYYKIKDTPEYKKQKKEYFKIWLSRNREKFNTLMRPLSKEYQRKKQIRKKEMDRLHDIEIRKKLMEENHDKD